MNIKTKTNGIHRDKYLFQPTKYDENDNLYCAIYRNGAHGHKCKMTILYKFDESTYDIIWVEEGWLNHNHKKLLNWFLEQYDWL